MKRISLAFIILTGVCFACNDKKTSESSAITDTKDTTVQSSNTGVAAKDSLTGTEMKIKAKFTDFSLGDASHFTFTDESGKAWDFGAIEDSTHQFAVELPVKLANETNQGWGPNKSLLNKWYNLTYTTKQQPLYPEGPVGDVMVITKAEEQ